MALDVADQARVATESVLGSNLSGAIANGRRLSTEAAVDLALELLAHRANLAIGRRNDRQRTSVGTAGAVRTIGTRNA